MKRTENLTRRYSVWTLQHFFLLCKDLSCFVKNLWISEVLAIVTQYEQLNILIDLFFLFVFGKVYCLYCKVNRC